MPEKTLPIPTKAGDRAVDPIPLKKADPERLAAVLAEAEALSRGRDQKADDMALAAFGDVDPVDWSVEAVRAEGRTLGDKSAGV